MRQVQEEQGIKVKTLDDEPDLSPHLRWVWKAFADLNYRRPVGFDGALPLSYTEIESYCSLKGIYSLSDRERLLRFIDVLDRQWMTDYRTKREKEQPTSPTSASPPPSHNPPRGGGRRSPPRTEV